MQLRSLRLSILFAFLLASGAFANETERLETALVLGPLPAAPVFEATPRVAATPTLTPEIDPRDWLPAEGVPVVLAPGETVAWRPIETGPNGFVLEEPGVYWLAARLVSDRADEVKLAADGGAALYANGRKLAAQVPAVPGGEVAGTVAPGRSDRFVYVRAVAGPDGGLVSITAESEAGATWDLVSRLTLSDFDRARDVTSIGNLAVSPGGEYVARRLSRRNPTGEGRRSEVAVLDEKGQQVASDLGGPSALPVAFSPDGSALLLRRGGDLLLWAVPRGQMRTVLKDEPGLGTVKFSPDGAHLLITSTHGFAPASRAAKAPHHWDVLRERVTDWAPLPHLHLVEVETGARRVLTQPGDYTLDDAAWLPDGRSIVYGRTLPQEARPWFFSEIRHLDLASGEDRVVATFTGGWEVRPQAFAPHPDGKRLAFLGPEHQVGDDHPEHNIYNKQVWMLDLTSGEYARVTNGMRYCFAAGSGLPAWDSDGRTLVAPANAGGRDVLTALRAENGGWNVREVRTSPGTGAGWAISPDASGVAFTLGGPTAPPALHFVDAVGEERLLEAPNATLASRWELSSALDATFTGPGGESIEAWWYRPTSVAWESLEAEDVPLIVYYYGGSSPTVRVFNTTHQFWAANGYAVLVINPRGASGYGDEFADHHAGDGGPKAAADIIAGTRSLLDLVPELDAKRVGCYGGSYGGFMTMYLVSHSDLFAAAVSMYGIADQSTYWGQGAWGWTYGDMANAGAKPWRDTDFFERASPLFQADQIHTPLLLLHGEADANVTPGESVEMFTALSTLGRIVEMVTFPGEDHGIGGTWANYVGHRTMMLEWFDRWLQDRPEAWERRWK